ncbi:MAG: Dabb family protein [Flavobacteriaceae bacterium]|nr:Dabb family protein [Flavobacteriaceae bacterium]
MVVLCFITLISCKSEKEKQPVASDKESTSTRKFEPVESKALEYSICYGSFAHNVYIWLKQPDNEEDREAFLASLFKFLDASEYVVSAHVGTPALSEREVVDDSFTFSIVLTFKDKADQDLYQVEPVHVQFVEEASHLWNKVIVYDSEDIYLSK